MRSFVKNIPLLSFILVFVLSQAALTGCSDSPPQPEPPASGKVGETSTFDIVSAQPGEIAGALSRDGRVSIRGVLFETDSASLLPDTKVVLLKLATVLEENQKIRLAVVGHTDSTGKFDYNKRLSQQRAESIVTVLQTDYKIDETRLVAVGIGPLVPVGDNETVEGRAQNRRVEFVLID